MPLRRASLVAIAVSAVFGAFVTRSVATSARANVAAARPSCTLAMQLAGRTLVVSLTATGLAYRASFEVDWGKPAGKQTQYASSNGSGVLRTTVLNNRGKGWYAASVYSLTNRRKAIQASCHTIVSTTSTPTGAPGPTATATAPPTAAERTSSSTPGPTGSTSPTPRAPAPITTVPPTPTTRAGGWPGPGNTGVPAGTEMTPSGSITVTTNGTVLNALNITGCVDIRANNVTIKDSLIHGGSCWSQVRMWTGYSGALIEDTEIDGTNAHMSPDDGSAIAFSGFTALRVNLHGNINGVSLSGPFPTVIQDSWMHDLVKTSLSHNQDILSNGDTAGITIQHNRLDNQITETGTIDLFGDFGPIQNVSVDGNLLNGGGYTVYGGHDPSKVYGTQDQNIRFTNNRFMRTPEPGACFANGGYWGPVAYFDNSSPGSVWSGNVWDDTGGVIGL